MTKIEELREKANRLPLLPGVYIMLDASGEVIYVGKAKALKNRVTSYFRGDHLPKVAAMVSHVNDFNVIIAETEFEALVLENSLIKRHKPHYNILLKDDKGYPFLRLDRREPYPRFTLSNRANPDGAKYFGPYGGRGQTMSIIDTLCKTLGLPTCRRVFPRDIGKDRPCLQYQMGACRGWCRGEPGGEEYRRAIGEAVDILEGRSAELVRRIETEMNAAFPCCTIRTATSPARMYRSLTIRRKRTGRLCPPCCVNIMLTAQAGRKRSFCRLSRRIKRTLSAGFRTWLGGACISKCRSAATAPALRKRRQ